NHWPYMTTSRVTVTAPSNASAPDEPTVVIERQAAPSARPTLSRRERDLADLAVGLREKAGNPFATALHRESCGGPRYGNSSRRSLCGPTLSPVTFPFVSMEKNTSTTSSVSDRPLWGKDATW